MKTKMCVDCGGTMFHETFMDEVTYKGHSIGIDVTGWRCQECKEDIVDDDSQRRYAEMAERLRIVVDGLLPPEEVRRIRERTGMSQREAGAVLGGGPNAFQKYESGEVRVSLAMSNLLRVIDTNPAALEVLFHRRLAGSEQMLAELRKQAS